jgi:hypothetical protein
MKKLIFLFITVLITASCAITGEAGLSKSEIRNNKKIAEKALVKRAVEDKRYIIKLDRLFLSRGGMVDLIPTSNYIIIDGDKAVISSAYIGRQYDIRPIAGINVRGRNQDYQLTRKDERGGYEVKLVVNNGSNTFNVYLTISSSGTVSASIINIKLDSLRYQGYLVPIQDYTKVPLEKGNVISVTERLSD